MSAFHPYRFCIHTKVRFFQSMKRDFQIPVNMLIFLSAYLFSITSTASHKTFWPMNTWITLKRKVKNIHVIIYDIAISNLCEE